jgi:hypothetical protein
LFDITNIRLQNPESSEIHIDEIRMGKMRDTFTMTQTKKALSFNGQVPLNFKVFWNNGRHGSLMRIEILTADAHSESGQ